MARHAGRVLITGARGFIGHHLVAGFRGLGWFVRAMDLVPPGSSEPPDAGVEEVVGDVTSPEDCEAAVRGMDLVVHLAATVRDWGPRERFVSVNREGTGNMVRAARSAGVGRFVLVSSVAVHHYRGIVHGTEDLPLDSTMNWYSRSKIQAERIVTKEAGSMDWVVVRPGTVPFGPGDHGATRPLLQAIEAGGLVLVSGGRGLMTTAYVENLVHGLLLAATHRDASRETFVIGDPWTLTWRGFFEVLATGLGVRPPWVSVPLPAAWVTAGLSELMASVTRGEPRITRYRVLLAGRDCHFVSSKAARLLGYRPRVGLAGAVHRTVRWYEGLSRGAG